MDGIRRDVRAAAQPVREAADGRTGLAWYAAYGSNAAEYLAARPGAAGQWTARAVLETLRGLADDGSGPV